MEEKAHELHYAIITIREFTKEIFGKNFRRNVNNWQGCACKLWHRSSTEQDVFTGYRRPAASKIQPVTSCTVVILPYSISGENKKFFLHVHTTQDTGTNQPSKIST
jgi:hypothetical protein